MSASARLYTWNVFFFFFLSRPSVQSITHHMHKPLYTIRPQVKIVPYCIYMITFWPSLIYNFPSLKYCSNKSVQCFLLFLHAVSAHIVMFKNNINNVALLSVDNVP